MARKDNSDASRAVEADGEQARAALAERIRERMKLLGLNPYSAAVKADLGQSFVRDILSGKVKSPSVIRLAKLAIALECSINYLLGETELELLPTDKPDFWRIDLPSPTGVAEAEEDAAAFRHSPQDDAPAAVVLPIRYELQSSGYRKATDVAKFMGYEATILPDKYRGRNCWWEYVNDDSVSRVAPKGSLVLVIELTEEEKETLQDGDFVIVASRHAGEKFNLVQRSMRRITHRYPDMGLWFYEFAHEDREQDLTDDVYRDDSLPRPRHAGPPPIFTPQGEAPTEPADPAHRTDPDKWRPQLEAIDSFLSDERKVKAFLAYTEALRVRVQGKVIKVVRSFAESPDLLW